MRKLREEPPERRLLKTTNAKKLLHCIGTCSFLNYLSTVLPIELERMSPRTLNFGCSNPATCFCYDVDNNITFAGFNVTVFCPLQAKVMDFLSVHVRVLMFNIVCVLSGLMVVLIRTNPHFVVFSFS